jgi:hypothetical protein
MSTSSVRSIAMRGCACLEPCSTPSSIARGSYKEPTRENAAGGCYRSKVSSAPIGITGCSSVASLMWPPTCSTFHVPDGLPAAAACLLRQAAPRRIYVFTTAAVRSTARAVRRSARRPTICAWHKHASALQRVPARQIDAALATTAAWPGDGRGFERGRPMIEQRAYPWLGRAKSAKRRPSAPSIGSRRQRAEKRLCFRDLGKFRGWRKPLKRRHENGLGVGGSVR